MKYFLAALLCALVLVAEVSAYTEEEVAIARLGVSHLGRGHTYVRIKSVRKQVSFHKFQTLTYIANLNV